MLIKKSLAMLLLCLAPVALAQKGAFTDNILQYAATGDVDLLQNLKAAPLAPDEKLAIDAITSSNGSQAAALYQKLLVEFPNSSFTALCRARLAEYALVLGATPKPVEIKPLDVKPSTQIPTIEPKPLPVASAPAVRYTLQFGSFSTKAAAEKAIRDLKPKVSAKILTVEDETGNKAFKVRWTEYRADRDTARAFGAMLGVDFFVVEER
ncbi:MAG: hypothetical protein HY22_06550 [[Candidatus Thermochlorobacteriaceae] bacterium GBChlB]|nr:MAG: hypothetical protein HY22_06550 [[Candidatus Thermochlorobacteriaceae] bacterium GBChlB]